MKFALFETRKQADDKASQFDVAFVLGESFENFENVVSIPASLTGSDSGFRDNYLAALGKHFDADRFDKVYGKVTKGLGVRPRDVCSLFELNIYSRHRELSDLAKANYIIKFMTENSNSTLTSYLTRHQHINSFLGAMLSRDTFKLAIYRSARAAINFANSFLPVVEFFKAQLWLHFLVLRALRARSLDTDGFDEANIILCPSLEEDKGGQNWGKYWAQFPKIEGQFTRRPIGVNFQGGFFHDHNKRPLRPFPSGAVARIYWEIQRGLFRSVQAGLQDNFVSALSGSESQAFANGLQTARWRSVVGPSMAQTLWEHHYFRLFFEQAKPHSVFYLCEGQPWETALVIQGRQADPNSRFFGMAHTAVRPWDLRYFRPPEWQVGPVLGNSAPDKLLVTSKSCLRRLTEFYKGSENTRLVETLRYSPKGKLPSEDAIRVVAIATTYSKAENLELKKVALRLMENQSVAAMLRIRSHPLRPVNLNIPKYEEDSHFPILTVCETSSTVAVELAEDGLDFVALHVGALPNMSPLADLPQLSDKILLPGERLVDEIDGLLKSGTAKKLEYYERNSNWDLWRSVIREMNL